MRTNFKELKMSLFKKLGFLGIGLCVWCCALPIIGTLLGLGTLSVIAAYLEKVGIVFIIASLMFFAIWFLRKGKPLAPSCDIDCECKNDPSVSVNKNQLK